MQVNCIMIVLLLYIDNIHNAHHKCCASNCRMCTPRQSPLIMYVVYVNRTNQFLRFSSLDQNSALGATLGATLVNFMECLTQRS